ncbi:26S protease regulatory subunit 8-like protein B-like [Cucumis melo var. makuwa]|uniref:26S protease regulatory subunit 8-like protein B-like n=1 Tax=Cucumis melo var. makuwa TaxID=1194695 RepID=A0A5D3BWM3_CUCMM|nr:26S protease regulatory subunit 8-like protein B-like [Cucumis melo var. makuwa]
MPHDFFPLLINFFHLFLISLSTLSSLANSHCAHSCRRPSCPATVASVTVVLVHRPFAILVPYMKLENIVSFEATLVDSFLAYLDELSNEKKFQVSKGFLLLRVNEVITMLVVIINEILELFVIRKPYMTIIAFRSTALDIFEVSDIMSSKGWHLNALQKPSRKMNPMRGIDLKGIAEKMNGVSGAEVKAVCTEVGMFALRERRVHVTQEDFEMAIAKTTMKAATQFSTTNLFWELNEVAACEISSKDSPLQCGGDALNFDGDASNFEANGVMLILSWQTSVIALRMKTRRWTILMARNLRL